MAETVIGVIDRDGCLERADPRLMALQSAAGGALGAALAVPALARLALLAQTLGILVSRSIIVAEGDHDLDLTVRAQPEGDRVRLAIGGWTRRPPRRPWLIADSPPPSDRAGPVAPPIRWTVDRTLRLTQCDGLDDAEAGLGKPLTALFRLIDDDQDAMPLLIALAEHDDFAGQRAVLRDDPAREVVLEGLAIRDVRGEFSGYIGTAHDAPVSAPEVAPVATQDAAFVSRLDAALRAPLARIAASADQINAQAEGPLRRDYADYAGDIGTAARHLLALVDDLADLEAIERPGFVIDTDAIDLADVARRAAGLLQVRASDRGVRIDRPADDENIAARGDFRRVLQILVNLIGNSIRYSPEGAHVWLRIERDADTAILIVADQGKGIDVADQARIFEKFERVDPSEVEGSGLGLYISRQLARAMGGDITVDSAPGQGARFVLALPAA